MTDRFDEKARETALAFLEDLPSMAHPVDELTQALVAQARVGYERGLEDAAIWHDKQRAAALTEARNDQLKDIDTPMYRVAKHHRDSATTIRAIKVKP